MIKNITTAEHYTWGGVCDAWRLLQRADLSVIQEHIPPGAGEVRHYHDRARQFFFVLSGRLAVHVNDERFTLAAGDSVEVAPGAQHHVRNDGVTAASFLVVPAPSTAGDRTNVET